MLFFPKRLSFSLILLLATSFFVNAQVQKLDRTHTPAETNLSESTVTYILQDQQGFMWFVSEKGLSRFDGYDFKLYSHDPSDPHSLNAGTIQEVYEDKKNILWVIIAGKGLDRLNRMTGHFKHYQHTADNINSLSSNEITQVFEDRNATLWFVSAGQGVNRYDRTQDCFIRYRHDPADPHSLSGDDVTLILEDQGGTLWFATKTNGLNRYNREQDNFTRFQHNATNDTTLSSDEINHLIEDDAGRLWIATSNGISVLDNERTSFLRFHHDPANPNSLSDNQVTCILQDSYGAFWIGTVGAGVNKLILPPSDSPLSVFDPEKCQFTIFKYDPNRILYFMTNHISFVFEDPHGDLWVGTDWKNLFMFDRAPGDFILVNPELPGAYHRGNIQRFTNPKDPLSKNWLRETLSLHEITAAYEDRDGVFWVSTTGSGINKFSPEPEKIASSFISLPNCQAIYEDRDGDLWMGNPDGLHKYDKNTGEVIHYDPAIYSRFRSSNILNKGDRSITAIYEDRGGRLWIGTKWTLNILDKSSGKVAFASRLIQSIHFKFIYEDRSETIWVGTTMGLIEYKPHSGIVQYHLSDANSPNTLSNKDINAIFEDHSGNIWVGTAGGLNRYDRNSQSFTRFLVNRQVAAGLSNNNIIAIAETISNSSVKDTAAKGQLWLATLEGIILFDPVNERAVNYTEDNGLANNSVVSMMSDNQNNLWLGTLNGLSRFSPASSVFRNFHHIDGLHDYVFNFGAYHQNREGGMYFGGVNGVTYIHPDSISDASRIPEITLTSLRILDQDIPLDTTLAYKRQLSISQQDKVFSIGFATLNYTNIRKNQFAYKLEGFDNDWIYSGNRNKASYTNLSPGEYTFRVKGADPTGAWNETGTSIKIMITPPWWKTGWAYLAYLLFTAGLIYGTLRYQLNRERQRQQRELARVETEKLREIDRLKSRFFANISHEFRTPLTLITGPVEQMLSGQFKGNITEQYRMILRNGNRLLRLINQLLDISRLEAGRLKLQACETEIVPFLQKVVSAFESLAVQKGIDLSLTAPAGSHKAYIDHDKLEKIMNNLLSNACKFTEAGGKIVVQLSVDSYQLTVISDQLSINNDRSGDGKLTTDNCLLITVKDSGIGIDAERLPHIFDRFYQVDDSQTRDQEGSGIGLALTKELVELHYGEITVESTPGRGSTFKVFLPLGKEHLKAEEIRANAELGIGNSELLRRDDILASSEAASIDSASKSENSAFPKGAGRIPHSEIVLIVEDNPDMRIYLKESLKGRYQTLEAEDGEQGLKKAAQDTPDLIISDVMMPKMGGYEMCQQLKNDERTSHIPVILLTAKADAESKITGLETGADDYLAKPFNARELLVRVKNLIELRRKLWQKFRQGGTFVTDDTVLSSLDARFLQRAIALIETHIDDPDFSTEAFGKEIGLSRSQLHRKLSALTGQSTHEFIRTLRLQRAAQLLAHHSGNVSEIAYQVGFNSPSHFTRAFREMFGKPPSAYAAQFKGKENQE